MISKKVAKALNEQIRDEFYSAYLYLAMSAYFEQTNLQGFANWMRVQFQEEQAHALKLFDYLAERGGEVKLMAIKEPPVGWDSPQAVFTEVLKHEQHVTALINKLVDISNSESDHATTAALQWFINEQVEEEATVDQLLQEIKMVKDSPSALFMMDRELGTRTFTPPAAPAA